LNRQRPMRASFPPKLDMLRLNLTNMVESSLS
jgi:hypothetical protein